MSVPGGFSVRSCKGRGAYNFSGGSTMGLSRFALEERQCILPIHDAYDSKDISGGG